MLNSFVQLLHQPCWDQHLEAALQRVAEVLSNLVNPDAAHCPDSQCPDQGVGVLRILRQSHDTHVWHHFTGVGHSCGHSIDQVSLQTLTNVFTAIIAKSGWVLA